MIRGSGNLFKPVSEWPVYTPFWWDSTSSISYDAVYSVSRPRLIRDHCRLIKLMSSLGHSSMSSQSGENTSKTRRQRAGLSQCSQRQKSKSSSRGIHREYPFRNQTRRRPHRAIRMTAEHHARILFKPTEYCQSECAAYEQWLPA